MSAPNIVLLVMDTARAQNLSCYGYDRETTPFLTNLVEDGELYERCYAQAPWTLPSHFSIFTGDYPSDHGKLSRHDEGTFNGETLPEQLSQEGYTTIGISSNGWLSAVYGAAQLFDTFHFNGGPDLLVDDDPVFAEIVEQERKDGWDSTLQKYGYFLRRAVRTGSVSSLLNGAYYFITQKFGRHPDWGDDGAQTALQQVQDEDLDEPFFLFINFVEPHYPYMPPMEYAERFLDRDAEEVYNQVSTPPYTNLGREDEELGALLQRLYDAELRYLDDQIQELHSHIEVRTDNHTVYIVTSDHGEFFGEHGLWEHHGGLEDEVLHVPLIVHGCGTGRHDDIVELRQLHRFVLDVAGGDEPVIEGDGAVAEYLGIGSHLWNHDFPAFDRCMAAAVDETGVTVAEEESHDRLGGRVQALRRCKHDRDELAGVDI